MLTRHLRYGKGFGSDLAILHSDLVQHMLRDFLKQVPEVPIRWAEQNESLIVFIPSDFDSQSGITRVLAFEKLNTLFKNLSALGVRVVAKEYRNVR